MGKINIGDIVFVIGNRIDESFIIKHRLKHTVQEVTNINNDEKVCRLCGGYQIYINHLVVISESKKHV